MNKKLMTWGERNNVVRYPTDSDLKFMLRVFKELISTSLAWSLLVSSFVFVMASFVTVVYLSFFADLQVKESQFYLTVATLMSLVVVPSIYIGLDDWHSNRINLKIQKAKEKINNCWF